MYYYPQNSRAFTTDMSSPGHSGNDPENRRKRPLESRLGVSYPRKRAVAACQVCRIRKVKCTNERPECAACIHAGATCTYADDRDHSSFDPAVLILLQKLEEIQQQVSLLTEQGPSNLPNRTSTLEPVTVESCDLDNDREALEVNTTYASADAVLSWPIFVTDLNQRPITIDDLFGNDNSIDQSDAGAGNAVISDENALRLVNRYIQYVHIKDPILDIVDIQKKARNFIESGPGWDSSSCLVLLCCALGLIARPFDVTPESLTDTQTQSPFHDDPTDRRAAESYYRMARKRFGLLEHDLASCQCYLLSAIYNMYRLRPLKAWDDFVKASFTFCVYWKGQNLHRQGKVSEELEQSTARRRLEQIIYWTSVKSECGLRTELPLPASGISNIDFPSLFPAPPPADPPSVPTHTPSPWSDNFHQAFPELGAGASQIESPQNTQYWYYYLTDIALRRISNRILNLLYEVDCVSWSVSKMMSMSKAVEEFESQLHRWKDFLPEPIRFTDSNDCRYPADELRSILQNRYSAIKLLLYRPFVGYLVSHPFSDVGSDFSLVRLAHQALETCLAYNTREIGLLHRHHGVWFFCRSMAVRALLVLAVKRAGVIDSLNLDGVADWEAQLDASLRDSVNVLRYWELESVDLRKMRVVIEGLIV
ncbi:unnamed protein product [Penicillium salamii]|uniref:Zn(2)-C6 fungal-type domain-containing protein n=1 Tax=Penicillium salamii TaxID=1612424 RepID=A0A9W4NT31_9EURO|nr:unnamed protein product [Penicillium salamii]CAG8189680.1 unnamed protein product [Penicillium salamii]CAG8248429.1 unnamed protein product [Penicillium salamii]CAG8252367.1 unnamed protein product [Penicillium salamii]CAG8275507.1 unnamed protein product [Penicillium salamii]